MGAYFGTAGIPDEFYQFKYKTAIQAPGFLERYGLDAFEYQCGRGVNISDPSAIALGNKAKEHNIILSVHAPYYISLSSLEEEKRNKSIEYIMQCAYAAKLMGAKRIVVHSGSCAKISRSDALSLALDTLKKAQLILNEHGFNDISLCPETMGKINQLGDLYEVLELCKIHENMLPTIDFGHLNARSLGKIVTYEDYCSILNEIENKLGIYRAKNFHAHFSKIEYSNGGEKCHLTFEDNTYGPNFEPLMEAIYKKDLSPVIICESAGTQAKDALIMKKYYNNIKNM